MKECDPEIKWIFRSINSEPNLMYKDMVFSARNGQYAIMFPDGADATAIKKGSECGFREFIYTVNEFDKIREFGGWRLVTDYITPEISEEYSSLDNKNNYDK